MSNTLKTLLALSLVAFVAACGGDDVMVEEVEPIMEEPVYEKL